MQGVLAINTSNCSILLYYHGRVAYSAGANLLECKGFKGSVLPDNGYLGVEFGIISITSLEVHHGRKISTPCGVN
jgi:hypothetical protein